jgi:YcxB-like protein
MELTCTVTQQDFYDALTANRSRTALARWAFRLANCFIYLSAALCLVLMIFHSTRLAPGAVAPLLGFAFCWAMFTWVLPRRFARKQFREQPAAHVPNKMTLDASGVHWRWDGGSSDLEWKNYIRVLESKRQFLFYTSPYYFHIVPKRPMTPQQVSDFRAMVERYLADSRFQKGF